MKTFGSYEATREIARTAFGQVWRARPIGVKDDRFVVKTIDCGDLSIVTNEAIVAARLDAFLDSAKTQGAAGEGWVPVHQTGRLTDSAYVVMDSLPLTVARLVEGRSAISGHVLVSMTTGLCAALRSAQRTIKRGHGNLKGANVFFDRDSDFQEARILIADPAATEELGPDKGEVADLHAIGDLIYQLVVLRPFQALGGWPVPPGKEWDRLGKVGSGWRELCSELLNPDLKPGQITLDQISERAAALTPPPRPVLRYVALATACVALIVGALLAWQNRPWKPLEWNAPLWTQVCDNSEWYSMVIESAIAGDETPNLQAFRGKVLVSGAEREGLLATTPNLAEIDPDLADAVRRHIEAFMSKGVDPEAWTRFTLEYPDVEVEGGVERAVGDLANDKARPPWMLGDARRFTAALGSKIMYQTPDFTQFREQAPDGGQDAVSRASYGLYFARFMQIELQRVVEGHIQALRERVTVSGGSSVPAPRANQEIGLALERGALWDTSDVKTAERLRDLAGVGSDAARLESGWKALTDATALLAGSSGSADPVVQGMQDAATQAISKADEAGDLHVVVETIERWAGMAKDASKIVAERGEKEIDWAALSARDGLVDVYEHSRSQALTGEEVERWIAAIKDDGYWKVTDPRPAMTAEPQLASAQKVLESIDAFEQEQSADDIAEIQGAIDAVRERTANTEALAWIRRNRETVLAEISATSTEAERVHSAARGLVANIESSALEQVTRWMSEDPASLTSVVAIQQKWDATRQALAVRLDPSITGSPRQLRASLRNVRRVLLWDEDARTGQPKEDGWAKEIETWGAADPEIRPRAWDSASWAAAIEDRREQIATALIHCIEGWTFESRLDRWERFDQVRSSEDRVWEDAEAWATMSREMAADYTRAESLIDSWYGFDEAPPDGGNTIRSIVERWAAEASMAEPLKCVGPVSAGAARLRSIPASPRAEHVALAGSPSEIGWARFAAWRALGGAPQSDAWPSGAAELAIEIAVRTSLAAQAAAIADDARAQVVSTEIDASGPVRWSVAQLRGGLADLDAVMSARGSMGVTHGAPGVDPRAAANTAIYEFAHQVEGKEEDDAKALASSLVAGVRSLALPGDAQARLSGPMAALDRTLGGGVTRKTLTQVLKENGPGRHKDFRVTSMTGGDDGFSAPESITYAGKSSLTVKFVRVNDSEIEPVYVCTEELSIAMAGALLSIYPGGAREIPDWYQLTAQNDPDGVITWELKGSRLAPFSANPGGWWSVDNVGSAEAFPEGMEPPGPPTFDTPVQWIEPSSIEELAATIGCRLPTQAEWGQALALERRISSASSQKQDANLRDATFTAFTSHVTELRSRSTVRSLEYPHRGSFDPGDDHGPSVAVAAVSQNDGSLWFEPTSHEGRGVALKHLIGNVAEFVSDTPGEKTGYGIVGGSAMSASPDVERFTPAKRLSSFADVGGRLAFSLTDLKPPMWAALRADLGDPLPYIFTGPGGE